MEISAAISTSAGEWFHWTWNICFLDHVVVDEKLYHGVNVRILIDHRAQHRVVSLWHVVGAGRRLRSVASSTLQSLMSYLMYLPKFRNRILCFSLRIFEDRLWTLMLFHVIIYIIRYVKYCISVNPGCVWSVSRFHARNMTAEPFVSPVFFIWSYFLASL